jgi:hypothetical protein
MFYYVDPENEAESPATGRIGFTWNAMPGRIRYILEKTLAKGDGRVILNRMARTCPVYGFLANGWNLYLESHCSG